jgi:probable HAF family extracellular repeat protein
MRLKTVACCFAAAVSFAGATATAQTYRMVELATLAQGNASIVRGPNGAGTGAGGGHLVDARSASGQRRGLVFEPGSTQQITGLAPGEDTVVFGINDTGALVGTSNTALAIRGFVGTRAGAVRELPPLGGDNASAAYALNNIGQAVGFSSGAGGQRAVFWDANGTPRALPAVPGVSGSRAAGINDRGDIVGIATTSAGPLPFAWPAGQAATDLMLLAGYTTGEANAVNAGGSVVGYSGSSAGVRRATLWPVNRVPIDLGTLPGGDFSEAFESNATGDIVGTSSSHAGSRAVLWSRSGGVQDLNSLVAPSQFILSRAVGINNAGSIIATGYQVPAGHEIHGDHAHDETHELPVRVFLLIRSGGQ